MANKDLANDQLIEYDDVQKKEKRAALEKKHLHKLEMILDERKQFFHENYEIFREDTWRRLSFFVKKISFNAWEELIDLEEPDLFIDPEEGSFSCYWKNDLFKLLIEISPNPAEPVHVFGKRIEKPHMEHELRTHYKIAHASLIDWLKMIHHE